MEIETDSSGQRFIMVDNVRVTVRRPENENDWAQTGRYLGFRSLQKGIGPGFNMGADLPIRSTAPDEVILAEVAELLARINSEAN